MSPKHRDHGQGALYQLKSRGLWRGVVDDGYWPDGRRRQRYVHAKTREECLKKLRRLLRELESGSGPIDHHTKVNELATRWLEDAGARLKPKTMQGYRSNVASSITPILGKRVAADLKPSDVRRLHSAIFARGVGVSSVAGAHRTLSAMLAYAVGEGIIARNVAGPSASLRKCGQGASHSHALKRKPFSAFKTQCGLCDCSPVPATAKSEGYDMEI